MEQNDNITCKVVLVGDTGVGKTCIIQRYVNNQYTENNESTVASTYTYKVLDYPEFNKSISFDIWDTSGRQVYRSLNKIFLRDVNIIVLVYDITKKQSFLELQYWLDLILENYQNAFLILVGNKNDLFLNREIKESDGKKFANVIHASFTETSAKNNYKWKDFLDNTFNNYLKMVVDSKNDKDSDDDDDYLSYRLDL